MAAFPFFVRRMAFPGRLLTRQLMPLAPTNQYRLMLTFRFGTQRMRFSIYSIISSSLLATSMFSVLCPKLWNAKTLNLATADKNISKMARNVARSIPTHSGGMF